MNFQFSLDTPALTGNCTRVDSPVVVSGWVMLPDDGRIQAIELCVDGQLVARAKLRERREDVAQAFPDRQSAMYSGFVAELVLDEQLGQTVDFDLHVHGMSDEFHPIATRLRVERQIGPLVRRERDFDLRSILACPVCTAPSLRITPQKARCPSCGASYKVRRGTPVFTQFGSPADSRLLENCFTHPYSEASLEIIEQNRGGLVLDFGSGNPSPDKYHPHVLFHEAVQYAQSDVVCITPRLPYQDGVFDAVISQAVFEHVPRPWEIAAELYRVLKPGGRIHLDTAFMQPFHGDPCHYFNMTISGLRVIFHQFEELHAGVKSYQSVAHSLRMQFGSLREHLTSAAWKERLDQFLREIDDHDLNGALDNYGHEVLAAGVFFDGQKPQSAIRLMAA